MIENARSKKQNNELYFVWVAGGVSMSVGFKMHREG